MKVPMILVVGLFALATAAEALAQGAPKLEVDAIAYDVGPIWEDESVEHTFTLRNAGTGPLRVTNFESSCGCTVVEAQPATLAPGQTTHVKARFNAGGYGGSFEKYVTVVSDDPTSPRLRLAIRGEVRRPVRTDPPSVFLERLNRRTPTVLKVTLYNQLKTPLAISDLKPDSEFVTAELHETEPGQRYELTVTVRPYDADVPLLTFLRFKTGAAEKPAYALRLTGNPTPRVLVDPPGTIALGTLEAGKEVRKTIRLYAPDDQPFTVTSVCVDNWRFLPQLREVRPGAEYALDVIIRPPHVYGTNYGLITVNTTASGQGNVVIGVQGELAPPVRVDPVSLVLTQPPDRPAGPLIARLTSDIPIRVTALQVGVVGLFASVNPNDAATSHELRLWGDEKLERSGQRQVLLQLATTHPQMPEVSLPVMLAPIDVPTGSSAPPPPPPPPARLPADGSGRITLAQLREIYLQPDVALVDARKPENFAAGHIPRALNLPVDVVTADPTQITHKVSTGALVVVYCSNADCDDSERLVRFLRDSLAYEDVRHFAAGFDAWAAEGLPVEKN